MSDRPTIEQIAVTCEQESTHDFLYALRYHGYVIVHPDDVPENPISEGEWAIGWNGCRRHIFATTEQNPGYDMGEL